MDKFNEIKEYVKKEIQNKSLLGDIRISDNQYQLLLDYFIYQTNLPEKAHYNSDGYKLMSDPAYAVALVQIGIHYYNGKFWPHIEKILAKKMNQSIKDRIDSRFMLTLKRYKKVIENDNEIVNTILMHGFVSQHYVKYLFDYLYRFYVIDLERDLTWEGYKDSLNYLIDVIQKGEDETLSQANRQYMLVKQTVDGIRVSKKQSVNMKFRWLLKTIDKLVYQDKVNENSNSRLIREFINWSKNSDNKKGFDKLNTFNKNGKKLKRNISPRIIHNPRYNTFYINIPGQRFLARHSEEVIAYLTIGEKIETLNLGKNELSTLIKTNDFEREIYVQDLFKNINLEIHIGATTKKYQILTGDPFVVFDENYESVHIEKDRQILNKGLNYSFSKPNLNIYSTCQFQRILKNDIYENNTFEITDSDYIVINDEKLLIPKIQIDDGVSKTYCLNGLMSSDLEVYNKMPLIYFKTTEDKIKGTIIRINDHVSSDLSCIKYVETYADKTIQAILDSSLLIKDNGVHSIEIDMPNMPKRRYKFVFIKDLEFKFLNMPYIFEFEGLVECENANISSNLEKESRVFKFEINENLENIDFEYSENNIKLGLQLSVPILKIELPTGEVTSESLGEVWHKDFPFAMKIKYPLPYSILVDNDNDYDQIIDAEYHNGSFVCDLTKLRTYIYEGNDSYCNLSIVSELKTFLLAKIFTAVQITEVSQLKFDSISNEIMFDFKLKGNDEIFISITNNDTKNKICELKKSNFNEFKLTTIGTSGSYYIEFFIKTSGFGNSYKKIYDVKRSLISNVFDELEFQIIRHYKGVRKFTEPIYHRSKKDVINMKLISDNLYNANIRSKEKSNEILIPIIVKLINRDSYLICKIERVNELNNTPLIFNLKNECLSFNNNHIESLRISPNFKILENYTFDLKIKKGIIKEISNEIEYIKKWGRINLKKKGILPFEKFKEKLMKHDISLEAFNQFLNYETKEETISIENIESLYNDIKNFK